MATTQYVVVDQSAVTPEQYVGKVALFNADGSPYTGGDSGPVTVSWADVEDKPAVIAAGADAAAARDAIGAGTSSLAIGTTASTAKAGDYQPTWAQVSGKPAVIAAGADAAAARDAIGAGTSSLVIGTTASTAKAGNAVQTATQTTATAIGPGTATNVQGILAELAARIDALEADAEA